ncbi:MAG: hypothetical protein ACRCZF_22600 [Gemmataceae bacterium]
MTILGKILLFFVLFISLFWNYLTINAYVTRTNWAEVAKREKANAKLAEENASYQRKLAEQTRDGSNATIAMLQQRIKTLEQSNETLAKDAAEAKKSLNDKLAADQVQEPKDKLLQTNIQKLEMQNDDLQKRLSEEERARNDAVVAAERAKADALKADLDKKAALNRADGLEQNLLKTTDELMDAKAGRTRQGVGAARTAPPEDFKATVTSVDGDLVEIDLGLNAKLQKGAQLNVFRVKPQGKYLGTIVIIQVDPFGAVGRFTPPVGVLKAAADDLPRKDDIVGVVK